MKCECSDPGCSEHQGREKCPGSAVVTVFRSDMVDELGTEMCEACAEDALDSGVFYVEED